MCVLLSSQKDLNIYVYVIVFTCSLEMYLYLLCTGFLCALSDSRVEFTIVTLKEGVSSAVGAAALGAKAAGLTLAMDHTANVNVLFHFKPS